MYLFLACAVGRVMDGRAILEADFSLISRRCARVNLFNQQGLVRRCLSGVGSVGLSNSASFGYQKAKYCLRIDHAIVQHCPDNYAVGNCTFPFS